MIYTCQQCERPLATVHSADGNICIQCMTNNVNFSGKVRKKVICNAFITLLLPLIITCGTALFCHYTEGTIHMIAIISFFCSLFFGLMCGSNFVKRYKTFVGEPELIATKAKVGTSWLTGKPQITGYKTESVYSSKQIAKRLYNLILSIIGAVAIYLIGWLLFIAICIKNRGKRFKKIEDRLFQTLKQEMAHFDFKIEIIMNNLVCEKLEVVNIHIAEKEYPYLAYHFIQDDEVTIVYGVLNKGEKIPYPLVLIYYRNLEITLPALGLYNCLLDSNASVEEYEIAFNAVPHHLDILKKYWTKNCQKLLVVESFFSDDE